MTFAPDHGLIVASTFTLRRDITKSVDRTVYLRKGKINEGDNAPQEKSRHHAVAKQ